MNVTGNLYSEDGTSPYIATVGTYAVALVSSISTLVETASSAGGGGMTLGQFIALS